jgi:adenylylsulfate kinase
MIILLTGLSGAGKTTVANNVASMLYNDGKTCEVIDGDLYRNSPICNDLSFSSEDRKTNIHRLGFIADRFSQHGHIAIIAAISPSEEVRNDIGFKYGAHIVYIKTDIEHVIEKDVKGLYKRAIAGKIKYFTGISDKYEEPENPDLIIDTMVLQKEQSARVLYRYITERIG